MSLEAIKSITAAEELLRNKKIEAQSNAKKAIADAEKAGAAAIAAAKARAEEETRALMRATEQKAAHSAEELFQSTSNKCVAIRARAESRFDKAASLIVRRVVES